MLRLLQRMLNRCRKGLPLGLALFILAHAPVLAQHQIVHHLQDAKNASFHLPSLFGDESCPACHAVQLKGLNGVLPPLEPWLGQVSGKSSPLPEGVLSTASVYQTLARGPPSF